ncbi:hypothetical protein PIIN_07792 [Serendipita indica DSM 11827]|uniref:Uncharacterized protein n=1 Tax=Serendipita indica (strain DSM 11827) TaxID=1109443 RepID=G4TR95_SERID|nr:hypothetical protein PIIN_07792 [Serendipita indica DSM 11827]
MDAVCSVAAAVCLEVYTGFCADLASVRHTCIGDLCRPRGSSTPDDIPDGERAPLLPSPSPDAVVASQPSVNNMKLPS